MTEELLDEFFFGSAQGGRKAPKSRPTVELLRSLEPHEAAALDASFVPEGATSLVKIRHSHHQVAKLLAEGVKNFEVALITGYEPAYLSQLRSDPTFVELMVHYEGQKELAFADVMERMKSLGMEVVDELRARFHAEPDKFTHREAMELCELMLVKAGHTAGRGGNAGPGSGSAASPVSLTVNFVPAQAERNARVIEHETPADSTFIESTDFALETN